MGRKTSKVGDRPAKKLDKSAKKAEKFAKKSEKADKKLKEERVRLHKSFKRSYREDYRRELEVPGVFPQIFLSLKMIFGNYQLFLPLLAILVVISEGLIKKLDGATVAFGIIVFLVLWLVTIYLLRYIMAGKKVRLRDGLYNAMAPFISSFLVLFVALLQCIPVILLIIAYSAAIKTDFLSTPFYALVFFIFAVLMIILTGYWLSSSLIALVAVSAPGLEPVKALKAASDLMAGRRINFIIRLIGFLMVNAVVWIIILLPISSLESWLRSFEWMKDIPLVSVFVTTMICFTGIFMTAYLYIYYRWLLDYKEER